MLKRLQRGLPCAEKGVTVMRDGREICAKTPKGLKEYRRRVVAMCVRQNWLCSLCGESMHLGNPPTFEHENGRGGGKRDDRIEINGKPYNSAAHGWCNGMKGSRRGSVELGKVGEPQWTARHSQQEGSK